ncbi:MAG: peptidoglycan-binding protein [Actinomycetota bacterium]
MRDLQRRLGAAGFAPDGAEAGLFCASTSAAITRFQDARGLRVTGDCDEPTWLALVEAGWRLGDRLLVLTAPMTRGDDVAELQASLNHLGFDCGRPDGILGPATSRALEDFQQNSGLSADAVCGPRTVQTLELVRRQSGSGPGVASVREAAGIEQRAAMSALRIVVGQFGGLSSVARSVARALRHAGATVMSTDEYEATAQAAAANRFGATVYLGFEARTDDDNSVSYFAVPTFESIGGRTLAVHVTNRLAAVFTKPPTPQGMRLPVLRETRMPAVLCSLGPVRDVVDSTDRITTAILAAVTDWNDAPLVDPSSLSTP